MNHDLFSQPKPRRLLADAADRIESYIEAAKTYPSKLSDGGRSWLYSKPFECAAGHQQFFYAMYTSLGLLQAMELPPRADILEVGCGPGWFTEILALLGHRVTAFDPSGDMLDIAKHRLDQAAVHHAMHQIKDSAVFLEGAIEEFEFEEGSFDAIIFYDVLHHVVDEQKALANCLKWMRPAAALGIIEGAWRPGNEELEKALSEEMAAYGTLENPFTQEYLDEILLQVGFVDIQRLVGVFGFFPVHRQNELLSQNAVQHPSGRNDLIARKPSLFKYSNDPKADTRVRLDVKEIEFDGSQIRMIVTIRNVGESILIGGPTRAMRINLAMRKGEPGPSMKEALNRVMLPKNLLPGEQLEFPAKFNVPKGDLTGWMLDAVAEHVAWLSTRGSNSVAIQVDDNCGRGSASY